MREKHRNIAVSLQCFRSEFGASILQIVSRLYFFPQYLYKKIVPADVECETPSKIDDKDLKFPTVKQRMPKALWSTDEKNLFFEALNEYGKDFDAVTAYICAKMKKKGMNDANLKTKTQVSHFYYRTWHKLSKHVHFDESKYTIICDLMEVSTLFPAIS